VTVHVGRQLAAAALFACGCACAPDDDVDAGDRAEFAGVAMAPDEMSEIGAHPFAAVEGEQIVPCTVGGVLAENGALEVRTQYCDPADVSLALPADVPAGAVLDAVITHDALVADGGSAHIAIVVGDEVVIDVVRAIPAPADYRDERAPLVRAHAAGELVTLHVHNHGSNTYALRSLAFLPE
jgi:hypothetical protein